VTSALYPTYVRANIEFERGEGPWLFAQNGDRFSAEMVRNTLGVGEVVLEATGVLESDVTVRLGKDWIDQSKQILKAQSKPN
jgi:hypothetical protein